jgi:hypothetical protein
MDSAGPEPQENVGSTQAAAKYSGSKPDAVPLDVKVQLALRLMDYAINKNLPVPKEVIGALEKARDNPDLATQAAAIDVALRDLTAITYPTTIETLTATASKAPRVLVVAVVVLILALTLLGGFSYGKSHLPAKSTSSTTAARASAPSELIGYASLGPTKSSVSDPSFVASDTGIWPSVLAMCLGGLGALFYIAYNLIGAVSENTFNANDWTTHVLRFALGVAIGWIFSFTIVPTSDKPIMLLLPFLGGFSTRLVVGIITQAIQAIALTLGLDSMNAELTRRRNSARAARSPLK